MDKKLRHGYTTGACAAAATLGAARMLREQRQINAVTLTLPTGETVTFALLGQQFDAAQASCYVIKDAGDDPDVTHGCELHATVILAAGGDGVIIEGGVGIGRVTKPGLAVAVGDWAINPVPRKMITEVLHAVFSPDTCHLTPQVTLSIPDGEERARRTLNARLGIIGGLSILGTSGVVRPISHQAWRDTLDAALDVAVAAGHDLVVLSGGRSSEEAAEQALGLPQEAYILMGDHVGHAVAACRRRGLKQIILCLQFAKLVKVAAGHDWTHAQASELHLSELAGWAEHAGLDARSIRRIKLSNTAREALLRVSEPLALAEVVGERALRAIRSKAAQMQCGILLIDYAGRVMAHFGNVPSRPGKGTES